MWQKIWQDDPNQEEDETTEEEDLEEGDTDYEHYAEGDEEVDAEIPDEEGGAT